VEQVYGLLKALGVKGSPPSTQVFPDPGERREVEQALARMAPRASVIGVHISARKRSQQWSPENFAALIRAITKRHAVRILLLWAPGEADNPKHPGDDGRARAVVESCGDVPVLPWSTEALSRLIAALSLCDCVVCADGGAMHLAAALGKPILCFFGDSSPERWRPWRTTHELLQPVSGDLKDLSVEQAIAGFERLLRARPLPQPFS
jgi:ADP-heptose:LPS heptosyltransferase